ncbi:alpha/beta hydrolase [Chondrinema litorale]|uniref:alpha/beta hydrolase n=1 Tax=Chondrinema litorale TaxID=2994555 RepID=UPI002543A4F4|nr:alpha/beta hydrolase [Chondrinema litorale]UZR93241.1 alpha/beta hydrolase [Chondrinema litorale]
MEKSIEINFQTHYETWGNPGEEIKYIWIACHGYGQLAKHFMRRFDVLNPDENYVIIPQGLSRFYLSSDYTHIGASWMTKEKRDVDIHNQHQYLNAVFEQEMKQFENQEVKLVLFGFSQGVSTVWRWAVQKRLTFSKLVMWAGEFPRELNAEMLGFVPEEAKLYFVIGTEDQYYDPDRIQLLSKKMTQLCKKPETILFEGKHEVNRDIILQIALD